MINDKINDIEYWEGIRDACSYLGRSDCHIAQLADQELALVGA